MWELNREDWSNRPLLRRCDKGEPVCGILGELAGHQPWLGTIRLTRSSVVKRKQGKQ